jgi:peptidoglycan/LPS O-acetylase OafA/YrhL
MQRIYFPGLNGLRFLAASAVIITHVELLKGVLGLPNNWTNPVLFNLGGLGVYFFFVLSGFLITYLLLSEKKISGHISIKKFYLRRIFRIWPIYYLLVLLAFFVFPHIPILHLDYFDRMLQHDFYIKLILFLLIFPNLALAIYPHASVPHAGHSWSIGVEEQFYIVWPWIIRKARNILRTIIFIGIGIVVFKMLVLAACHFFPASRTLQVVKEFVAMTKMECMAIGGAGACIMFGKMERWIKIIYNPWVQAVSYAVIPLLIYFLPASLQDGEHILFSFAFLVIIINVATNPSSFLKLENRALNFLGTISYGMYMYHMFVIVLVIRLTTYSGVKGIVTQNIFYYSGSFLGTILVSAISYYFFEKYFLRLNRRSKVVESGFDPNTPAK